MTPLENLAIDYVKALVVAHKADEEVNQRSKELLDIYNDQTFLELRERAGKAYQAVNLFSNALLGYAKKNYETEVKA